MLRDRRFQLAGLVTVLLAGGLVLLLIWITSVRPQPGPATETQASSPSSSQPSAASTPADPTPSEPAWSAVDSESVAAVACDGVRLAAPANPDPAATVAAVAAAHGVQLSMSWFDPEVGVLTTGDQTDLTAWSTSKVPVALAVVASGQGAAQQSNIRAALRWSDNPAAEQLWQSLGPDDWSRAEAVTAVLRAAGDPLTTTPAQQNYPPYSVYGQTQWSSADQVEFLRQLPCLSGADQVLGELAEITASQRWGLGGREGAVFKGGWGPLLGGGQLARQMGWYTDPDGARVLIALSVHANSQAAATAAVDDLVSALG